MVCTDRQSLSSPPPELFWQCGHSAANEVAHGPAVLPYPPAVPLTLLSLCLILWHPSLAVYSKFKQNHIENLLSLLQALRLKLRTEPTLRNESLNFREQGEFFF